MGVTPWTGALPWTGPITWTEATATLWTDAMSCIGVMLQTVATPWILGSDGCRGHEGHRGHEGYRTKGNSGHDSLPVIFRQNIKRKK